MHSFLPQGPSYLPAKTSLALVKPHSLCSKCKRQHAQSELEDFAGVLSYRCSTRTTPPSHTPKVHCKCICIKCGMTQGADPNKASANYTHGLACARLLVMMACCDSCKRRTLSSTNRSSTTSSMAACQLQVTSGIKCCHCRSAPAILEGKAPRT